MSDPLVDLVRGVLREAWDGNLEGVDYGVEPDEQLRLAQSIVLALSVAAAGAPSGVLPSLGLHPVAMADTDCGWVVSASVEAAGAWSTVPDGGWTRDG